MHNLNLEISIFKCKLSNLHLKILALKIELSYVLFKSTFYMLKFIKVGNEGGTYLKLNKYNQISK